MSTEPTNTRKQNIVRIAKIERIPAEAVYNMEVEDNHNFAVNGGIIVHNCMDATRYFVKTMNIVKPRNAYIPSYMR